VGTEEGPTLVGAGGADLSAGQKAVAEGLGLTVVEDLPGAHAEATVIQGAANMGLTPTTGYSTNLVCGGSCGPMITGMGGWVNGRYFGF